MLDDVEYLRLGDVEIEYRYLKGSPKARGLPTLVFLHEGLGSTEQWRNIPDQIHTELCDFAVLVYSRPGYGNSTPVAEERALDYMHKEAQEILPRVLKELDINRAILIGHSDGASIAIINAGSGGPVLSLVLIAPHVFVEEQSVAGIQAAKDAYLSSDLPSKLARYHKDVDATFWGWNKVWLSEPFLTWNIEEYLPNISVPMLLIQGDQDEYGTLAQLDAISSQVKGDVEALIIAGGHHAPHLESPDEVVKKVVSFVRNYSMG